MPFSPIAGVAKCEILFHNEGFDGVNVMWLGGFDTTDSSMIQEAAGAFEDLYVGQIMPQKTSAFVLDAIRVTSWDTASGPQFEQVSGAVGGRSTATPANPERSALIQLRTALRGRSHRGRIYDAGYADDQFDGRGRLSPSSQDQIRNNWLAFRDLLLVPAPNATFMVVSHVLGLGNPVTDFRVSDVVGIQRRRIRD